MPGLLEKAGALLRSEQGERIGKQVLDKAAEIASTRTGGAHDDEIAQARRVADALLRGARGQEHE